jgi:hypothetical protein
MTEAIGSAGVVGFASELAQLLLETESAQSDSARLQQDAARQEFLTDANKQIAALHQAADDAEHGAWASAAFAAAGSACAMFGALDKFKAETDAASLCGADPATTDVHGLHSFIASESTAATLFADGGQLLNGLAAPAKSLLGDAPAAHATASAKYFETLSENAKWLEGDASTEIDNAAKQGDKILDLLQGINQDQNSANNALIGRI